MTWPGWTWTRSRWRWRTRPNYEHRWLINPETGEVALWTSDTGIDGETPVELDELDLIAIDPLPSHVWYQDMADFAAGLAG